MDVGTSFVIGAVTQSILCNRLYMKHILNHSNGALDMNVAEFRSAVSKNSLFDVSPILMLRGGILGTL